MLIKSCYGTTALTGFPVEKTDRILNTALASNVLKPFSGKWDTKISLPTIENAYMIVDADNPALEGLAALKHPYVLTDPRTQKTTLIMDARTMTVMDRVDQEYIVRGGSKSDFAMLITRMELMGLWLNDQQLEIRSTSVVPAVMFARWVSSTVTQRYMLDPREQETIEVLSGLYYYTQFTNDASVDLDKIVGYMSRNMGLQANRCYELLGDVDCNIQGVTGFCKLISDVTGSIRLKDFNPGHLYTSLGMSYFGMLGKELTAIALEHPPTWIAMLLYAVSDAMYRKSAIGTMMDRGDMRQKSKDFVQSMYRLTGIYL